MAAGEKIGVTRCDCPDAGSVEWTEGKKGNVSGKCITCGEQRFKRSPKAVDGLKRQLTGTKTPPPGAPGPTDKKPGLFGEPLDLKKL
jgi:hypothetical protein